MNNLFLSFFRRRISLIALMIGVIINGSGMIGSIARAQSVTMAAASSCRLTPGNVYRAPVITTVYYITSDCQKRPIFNPAVYFSYYADWAPVIFVEQTELDVVHDHPLRFMPWGPLRTFENGSLIKTTDDPHVFLIADGKAYPFGSEEAFKSFGYSFDQVEDVSVDGMAKFQKQQSVILTLDHVPASTIFKYLDTPEVYVLVNESGVLKKWHITTMEELRARGRADRIAVFPATKVFENGMNSPGFQVAHVPLQFSFNLSETTSTLSGTFTLEVIPMNNAVISSVKYYIESTPLATVTSAPFTYPLNTASYLNLPSNITAVVTGDDGEVKRVTRPILIKNVSTGGGGGSSGGSSGGGSSGGSSGGGSSNSSDTTPPVVTSFSLPASANSLTVTLSSFSASDAVGVTGYLLTETAGMPSASAGGWTSSIPTYYAFTSIGSRTLYAWAKDAAGNVSLSRNATVLISDTQPPIISSVSSSTNVNSAIITWTTDEYSTSTVEYGTGLSYGSVSSSGISVTSHSVTLSGLTANTLYHFRVSSADGSNNRTVSGDRTFRTTSAPDVTSPSVSITAPLTGATVSGTALSIQATATDNVAIASVMFKMDGTVISSDSSSPYTATLNTEGYANGTHAISAVAIDNSNNRSTSTISVTVNNAGGDAAVPVVSAFTLPSTSLSRMVTVSSFTATDNVGITGYALSESSNQPSPSDGGWSATPQTIYGFGTDGLKTLYAWAKDAAGNVSLSASASVTVDTGLPIVGFTSPTQGSTISGTSTLVVSATDAFSIASVSFRIDGSVISLDSSSPYTASLNTALYATGTHTLTAIATDVAGNAAIATVTVTIATGSGLNSDIVIASVASSTDATRATISWTTNEFSNTRIEYGTTTAYGSSSSSSDLASSHSIQLTDLIPNTLYHFRVSSQDASGNITTSDDYQMRTKRDLGINFFYNTDWDYGYLFADVVKQGRYWSTSWPTHASVDANGWPTEDANIVLIGTAGVAYPVSGTYKLSFEASTPNVIIGTYNQEPSGSVTISNQVYNNGVITADVTLSPQATVLWLSFSNTGNGVRNVKVMRPGYAPTDLFARDMLEAIAPFSVIRPMQAVGEPTNRAVNWSQRRTPTSPSQANDDDYGDGGTRVGVSYEYLIMLANEAHKDLWLCLPRLVTDDYIRKLAQLVKFGSDGVNPYTSVQANPLYPPLDPNLNLYVEYSNEVWNYNMDEERDMAVAEYNAGDANHYNYDDVPGVDQNGKEYYWGFRRIAHRAMTISNIFRSVFGDAVMPGTGNSRMRPVLAGQSDRPATYVIGIDYLNAVYGPENVYGNTPHPMSYYLYALSTAPYPVLSDSDNVSNSLTVNSIFAGLNNSLSGTGKEHDGFNVFSEIDYVKTVSSLHGLKMVAYEGGQSLWQNGHSDSAKSAAQTDSRMKTFTKDLINYWYSKTDGVFTYFTIGNNGWFTLGSGYQDNDTPKWQALKEISVGQ